MEIIGIKRVYKDNDPALFKKTIIHCVEIKEGKYRHKSVMVTDAEKWLLESIAMRIFLHHKKYVDISKERVGDDLVEMKALMTVEEY